MKTFQARPSDVIRKWYVIDASEAPLGRVATAAAKLLIGKDKPQFTKHIDCGDYVIIINSDTLVLTGNKTDKQYYRHSMYPGGLKSRSLKEQMEVKSEEVVRHAIRGMLPVNKLRDDRLARLKIYTGSEHGHSAQKPENFNIGKK